MNILSIDFDIIMAPDINFYNGFIGDGVSIDALIEEHPMLVACKADLQHYQKIVNFLLYVIDNLDTSNIRVAFNHEDIKYLLESCDEVNVYSIDHHHDLGYPIPPELVEKTPAINCSNWGEYFISNGTIKNFTWIKNSNSETKFQQDFSKYLTIKDLNEIDLFKLPHIDQLFLCLSPEWVPSMYHPLFYTILDLINEKKNCMLEVH